MTNDKPKLCPRMEQGGMRQLSRIVCMLAGHRYRVVRRMNPGARKVTCDRCRCEWGMHDATRAFVPWDDELEAAYAPGGPLDPTHYKGC